MAEETSDRVDKNGDRQNPLDQMFADLYADLRRLADRALRRNPGGSVSPTTLVHEVYLNFSARDGLTDRQQFLAYSARAMRSVLIDLLRRGQALKRGMGFHITQLSTEIGEEFAGGSEFSRLSEALDALAVGEPRLAEVVDLKYFCGFSFEEIAALRGTSERTVRRDWERRGSSSFRISGRKAE